MTVDHDEGMLAIERYGRLTRADFGRLTAEGASLLAVSLGELHQVVRAIAEAVREHGVPHTELKRALVFAADAAGFAFYEAAALHRNLFIRILRGLDDARRRLTEPEADGRRHERLSRW